MSIQTARQFWARFFSCPRGLVLPPTPNISDTYGKTYDDDYDDSGDDGDNDDDYNDEFVDDDDYN
jgi:hypothetical protein